MKGNKQMTLENAFTEAYHAKFLKDIEEMENARKKAEVHGEAGSPGQPRRGIDDQEGDEPEGC